MPYASAADGVKLYYEEVGQGTPIVFVHEFADDIHGWAAQVKFFARRYRTIAFNARYLIEILSHVDSPQVKMEFLGPLSPAEIGRAHV